MSTWRSTAPPPCWPGWSWACPAEGLIDGLARFGGVHRRFELKGVVGGVRVYDDYAHHPTEVTAQLTRRPRRRRDGRLVVAFQPHLYSRTQEFAEGFGEALGLADEVVVMDVYGAREDPVPGVTGAMVADAVPLPAAGCCSSRPGRPPPRRWPRGRGRATW